MLISSQTFIPFYPCPPALAQALDNYMVQIVKLHITPLQSSGGLFYLMKVTIFSFFLFLVGGIGDRTHDLTLIRQAFEPLS